ncbi:hypothetical protein FSP39_021551 [Pinctada imbricata]|uniref:Thioesterase domain-containing protein n=1 Tax=Pinctada imbricata TaxID=66713 RepID=A0AA89BXX1_PINIB|nr:hypothetical protein FSP39_021551 [Pinctada imbricata]
MASLVDSVTSWAFHAFVTDKRSMSMDLHMTYMRAVPIGKKILIEARTIKHGRRVVFLEADIKSSDGTLYARALHTKLIMGTYIQWYCTTVVLKATLFLETILELQAIRFALF